MVRSAFSTAAFAQLVRRLRYTNARYNQIAHHCRSKRRPTHHAKRHAFFAGLRVDTLTARACPLKHISTKPLPVIATPLSPMTNLPQLSVIGGSGNVLDLKLTNLPDVVAHAPVIPVSIKQRRADRRQKLTIRVPPLALNLNYGYGLAAPLQGFAPNAPLLKPAQLPEDDGDMEEISLNPLSSSTSFSSTDTVESLLTPIDVMYSGLRITIPPRGMKRKLQDVDENGSAIETSPSQPKRIMKTRWYRSQGRVRV